MKTDNHPANVPLDELPEGFPEDLWIDLVTEQPEGYVVDEKRVDADDDSVEINVSSYNSGVYLMKITLNNGQTFTEKVVVR
ncbi:MAG: T9SS type A sorting domain-containing protein [Lentimicrobiaceae bacterium]|nr:T9SS type A sorting domain-containing protein [Lentimicrobiaceae bacterium]